MKLHRRKRDGIDPVEARANDLLAAMQATIHRRADRIFANLMVVQWLAGIAAVLWISPRTWIGGSSQVHWHVWAAVVLGGLLAAFPVYLAWTQPGRVLTRHVIAVAQMLTSALLIHITGGRIETHFHIFGSLAFFAFYRDWRVLVTATAVVALDHMVRGLFWPQSVFGVLTASSWRWVEHAGWVLFEDTFLFISIRQSLRDMTEVASRRAKLEAVNAGIERQVSERTAELTEAHRELQASEQRFRMLSACAPIGIFETDAKGRGLYTNTHWQAITGLSLQESLGDGWRKAVHPDDLESVSLSWAKTAAEGRELDRIFRFRRPTGEVRWVHATTVPMLSETGEVTGHVGTAEDITEKKQAEEARDAMELQLRHAQKMESIGQLAAGIAHEINTPTQYIGDNLRFLRDSFSELVDVLDSHQQLLRAARAGVVTTEMLADAEALMAKSDLDYLAIEIPKALRQSLDGVERVSKIVRAMKEFSHPGEDEKVPLDINHAIESTLTVCRNEWKYVAEVVTEFDPELPPVPCLPGEFNQVILNLVVNASHAIADVVGDGSRGKGAIHVSTRRAGDWVEIRIRDTGTGIPEKARAKIFDPFFTTKPAGKGTGQGLAIAHSVVVDKHGGSITFETEMGRGTTFIIRLPLVARTGIRQQQAA